MFAGRAAKLGGAATTALGLLAGTAAAGTGGHGSAGLGDPYFPSYGNGGYNVSHYDIRLRYQPRDDRLWGTTTVLARATQVLTRFNLDFALGVRSVHVNGRPARFVRQGTELQITPATVLRKNARLTVVVAYDGVPSKVDAPGFTRWIRTSDGGMAVGEPEAAIYWYPSNDHPRDKATFDISVAVPEGVTAVSNGLFLGTRDRFPRPGWKRWNWRVTSPMATYLASLVIGDYDLEVGEGSHGRPFVTAYAKGLGADRPAAEASIERTPEIVRFFAGLYGDYPFEAEGGVVTAEGLTFALENQTRPSYSRKYFTLGSNTYVVAHEAAHQWFGDSVSVDTWRDLWLNEGFATYGEWLWSEHIGEGTAQEIFDYEYSRRPADDPFWQVLPADPGADLAFHRAVYDRGAMALHALRTTVGFAVFKRIMRTWAARRGGGTGTIEQFIELAEHTSGRPLRPLFDTWLFSRGRPAATAATAVSPSALSRAAPPRSVKKIVSADAHPHRGAPRSTHHTHTEP
ncbi:M1 family metallopeptidase [Actinomadura sp. 3N407]|uniref:M1 family metallopeptidase n=1 Tax=Actinomadura sp. 3N407 TaxID=3457423 RepID=UPI003FCE6250